MRTDKDRAKARELFRQMPPKEKWAYVFQYYWAYMLAVVVVVGVVCSITNAVRDSIARENYLYVALQEGYYIDLQPKVEAIAREIDWPEELNYASFPSVSDQEASGSYQLVLYLTADQVDFIVCDSVTKRALLEDDTLDLIVVPLEQTPLGEQVEFEKSLFVIAVNDTARQEKMQQFMPALMG